MRRLPIGGQASDTSPRYSTRPTAREVPMVAFSILDVLFAFISLFIEELT